MSADTRSKKLVRPFDHRLIAGVCAGLANWLGWNITLTRIAFVVVSTCSAAFPGIIVYIVLWILMPESDRPSVDLHR